jgi:hypothetical protein
MGNGLADHKNPPPINWAAFAHFIRFQANAVKFAHQSLGNLKISTLMKALRKGFLQGCPNINKELVAKYLNPSPATAKGHRKHPKKGIRSTTPQPKQACRDDNTAAPSTAAPPLPVAQPAPAVHPLGNNTQPCPSPAYNATNGPNVIVDDESIANVFCFAAFADKVTGVMYNELTGNCPFMLLDRSVCFFVMYHCETNAILATPIANLDGKSILRHTKLTSKC